MNQAEWHPAELLSFQLHCSCAYEARIRTPKYVAAHTVPLGFGNFGYSSTDVMLS